MQILVDIYFLQVRSDVDPLHSTPVESLHCSDSEPTNVNPVVSYFFFFNFALLRIRVTYFNFHDIGTTIMSKRGRPHGHRFVIQCINISASLCFPFLLFAYKLSSCM